MVSEEFERPEEGMWKLWPEDWVETVESMDMEVSTEGKGVGPVNED